MARRVKRRETEIFSISFLDCITCGLGSVVLLLVLSNMRSPRSSSPRRTCRQQLLKLQDELIEIQGQSDILNRDLKAKQVQLSDEKQRIARLQGDLSDVRGKYHASKQEADVANQLEGRLASAQQTLTDEMKRLLGQGFRRKKDDAIGGIPVDSEYIIFIIDTSGSMFNYVWPMMLKKVEETLNMYPKVKGFQVMNDEGVYMFSGYKGKWIPDTPHQRRTVVERLRTWNAFSNSSPIEGIVEAIRTYHAKDKKISLYVFGDEFTGSSIDSVVKGVDIINREDETGERRVRIHAIGFPVRPDAPQYTSIRFATLMRILCQRNGGTFVGLDEPERGAHRSSRSARWHAKPADSERNRGHRPYEYRAAASGKLHAPLAWGLECARAGGAGRLRPGEADREHEHPAAAGREDADRRRAVHPERILDLRAQRGALEHRLARRSGQGADRRHHAADERDVRARRDGRQRQRRSGTCRQRRRAILEPSIEEFAFVTPRDAGSPFFAVSIKYRVNIYLPDGKLADSWGFTGYGTAPAQGTVERAAAADRDCTRDARCRRETRSGIP